MTPEQVKADTLRIAGELADEEALLGAMMLSRDAIVAAVELQLDGSNFYEPLHGRVFDAITDLYAKGEPVDPITVAGAGLMTLFYRLRGVDTLPILDDIRLATPAIGWASKYARLVEERSLLRRLVGVAGEISKMGYSVPGDVAEAIRRARGEIDAMPRREAG